MRPLLFLAALAMLLYGCSSTPTAAIDVGDAPVVAAPGPDARLAEGGWPELAAVIRDANARGEPVVVNLFASWCEPCKDEAPLLARSAAENRDVTFVGVNHRDLRERGEAFLAEHPLGFVTLWDFEGDVAETIRGRGMPTTAFFDTEGRLVDLHTGIIDEQLLERRLDELRPAA